MNTKRNIELELRAEVSQAQYKKLLDNLENNFRLISRTKRLSAMFFGTVEKHDFDIRVRITDGKAEVVTKRGSYHAEDRIEFTQPIEGGQFLGMVRIFDSIFSDKKVAERETSNFDLGDGIILSLVSAGGIAYIEVEKMSAKDEVETNRKELLGILEKFGLELIASEEQFTDLCERLTRDCDWRFGGSKNDYLRLKKLLNNYLNK